MSGYECNYLRGRSDTRICCQRSCYATSLLCSDPKAICSDRLELLVSTIQEPVAIIDTEVVDLRKRSPRFEQLFGRSEAPKTMLHEYTRAKMWFMIGLNPEVLRRPTAAVLKFTTHLDIQLDISLLPDSTLKHIKMPMPPLPGASINIHPAPTRENAVQCKLPYTADLSREFIPYLHTFCLVLLSEKLI